MPLLKINRPRDDGEELTVKPVHKTRNAQEDSDPQSAYFWQRKSRADVYVWKNNHISYDDELTIDRKLEKTPLAKESLHEGSEDQERRVDQSCGGDSKKRDARKCRDARKSRSVN